MKSLDPRVERLPEQEMISPKAPLDQFGTFEVFVQGKEGMPFRHEGIVHAPNLEMAYVLAKETFTRRFTCVSLYVVDTRSVSVSSVSNGEISAYDLLPNDIYKQSGERAQFEIYHLPKRGRQHVHAGTVDANSPLEAMIAMKNRNDGKIIHNVWAIRKTDIRFTGAEDLDFWHTLPDKKFRDAAEYKGGEKLKDFLARNPITP